MTIISYDTNRSNDQDDGDVEHLGVTLVKYSTLTDQIMTAITHIHSFAAWTLLLLLLISSVAAIVKRRREGTYGQGDKNLFLITMILSHVQLILGFVLFFTSQKVVFSDQTMSEAIYRFFTVEHPVLMIIAVILITVGYSKSRKAAEDRLKFKRIYVYYLIGLAVILLRFPYKYLSVIGQGWFS